MSATCGWTMNHATVVSSHTALNGQRCRVFADVDINNGVDFFVHVSLVLTFLLSHHPSCLVTTGPLFMLVHRDQGLWQRQEPTLHTELLALLLTAGPSHLELAPSPPQEMPLLPTQLLERPRRILQLSLPPTRQLTQLPTVLPAHQASCPE
jgi:hypothetical protein